MATPLDVKAKIRQRLHDPRQRTYWLVEFEGAGPPDREAFLAPSDDVALDRALDVAEGEFFELWEGERLVRRWSLSAPAGRSFTS